MKELGYDRQGIKKTMRLRDYIGDGMGQFGMNLVIGLSGQISYFYTEKVGVAAATVSAVMLVAKVIDAFTDLPMGKLLDNGKSKNGKCRPWFLRCAPLLLISTLLLFFIPKSLTGAVQFIYMLISNVFLTAIVYTAFSVAYGSIAVLRTKSSEERGMIQVTRTIFSYLSGAVVTVTVIPITNMLGGDQAAWMKFAIVCGVVGTICMLILYKTSRESDGLEQELSEQEQAEKIAEDEKERSITFFDGVKMLMKNKAWVYSSILMICSAINYGMSQSTSTYYAKYIYGNDNLVAVSGGLGLLGVLIGFFVAGPMIKRLGITKTLIVVNVAQFVPQIVRMFNPYSFWLNVIIGTIFSIVGMAGTAASNVTSNNSVAFNEKLYGVKLLGMSNAVSGFAYKVGNGVGIASITFILAITGYDAALSTQPKSVIYGIFAFSIYIPMVVNVVETIFSIKYVKYEKEYNEMMAAKYQQ